MAERFIAFDVETPNGANDRMSAIGVSVVEQGRIIEEFSTLVNPETYFHYFNIQLTGITPEAVSTAPTFPLLWQRLEPLLSGGLLLAHNAPFDMGVLGKCLRAYGIVWKPFADYACTCRMSRACFPTLENHRLNTVCEHLHISLSHHQAASDSRACAEIFCACREMGLDVNRFRRTYDFTELCTLQESRRVRRR